MRPGVSSVVLDASAILALLNAEPGADEVEAALPGAVVCAVNFSEVVGKLADLGMPEDALHQALDSLALDIVPFDEEQAYTAGMLRPLTASIGLSLGDRACLALAKQMNLPAVTADRSWVTLRLGIQVRSIR